MNYLPQFIERARSELFTRGDKFQDYNLISSISILAYILSLIINGTIGVKTGKSTSDKYQLIVTPQPGFFSIWGIIFSTQLIALIWSIETVSWSLRTHLYFWLYCLIISLFVQCWARATKISLLISNITLILLIIDIFLILESTLNIEEDPIGIQLVRCTLSFQLGWVICTYSLNFCIFLVYNLNVSQQTISKVVWIIILFLHSLCLCLCNIRLKKFNFNYFGAYLLSASWGVLGVYKSQRKFCNSKEK